MGHYDINLKKQANDNNNLESPRGIGVRDQDTQNSNLLEPVVDRDDVKDSKNFSPKGSLPFEVVLIAIIVAVSFANAIALVIS